MQKNVQSFFLIFGFIFSVNAQSTAENWTLSDCDGNTYSLFEELDKGKIVVMDFVMLGCGSCITASTYINEIDKDYKNSNPDKVLVFSMAYTNGYSCSNMQSWKDSYGFTFPSIAECNDEVNYYGGMGMPTIVVVGGIDHKIYYKKIGFTSSEDSKIRSAIDDAISQTTGIIESTDFYYNIEMNPNPTKNLINLNLVNNNNAMSLTITIIDIKGSVIDNYVINKQENLQLDVSSYQKGMYFLCSTDEKGKVYQNKFIKY